MSAEPTVEQLRALLESEHRRTAYAFRSLALVLAECGGKVKVSDMTEAQLGPLTPDVYCQREESRKANVFWIDVAHRKLVPALDLARRHVEGVEG